MDSGARLFPGASPESITTVADFENHWIHIAPREFSWLWIPGLRHPSRLLPTWTIVFAELG
jgi:hypothetical protein